MRPACLLLGERSREFAAKSAGLLRPQVERFPVQALLLEEQSQLLLLRLVHHREDTSDRLANTSAAKDIQLFNKKIIG